MRLAPSFRCLIGVRSCAFFSRENAKIRQRVALHMQNSADLQSTMRKTSAKLSNESVLRLAPTFCDSGVQTCAKFSKKTHERAANVVEFRCIAHAGIGWPVVLA